MDRGPPFERICTTPVGASKFLDAAIIVIYVARTVCDPDNLRHSIGHVAKFEIALSGFPLMQLGAALLAINSAPDPPQQR